MINKRGILGIKWIYVILGIAAYFFRKQISDFCKPYLDKMKKSESNPQQ